MQTPGRISVVAAVLLVFIVPLAGASEPAENGADVESRGAPKEGRADGMAAWSVDSGGGESSGGDFTLTAAIGQPDAGVLSQGDTVLAGGLWAGTLGSECLFCNGFESGGTGAWSSVVGGTE